MNRREVGCKGHDFVKHRPRVLLRFFWNETLGKLRGVAYFGHDCEGPPGGAHGASIALVFDEILAYPAWRSNYNAFTVSLTVDFRNLTPLGSLVAFEAGIDRIEGRKLFIKGKITSGDRKIVYSEGHGLWLKTDKMKITKEYILSKI